MTCDQSYYIRVFLGSSGRASLAQGHLHRLLDHYLQVPLYGFSNGHRYSPSVLLLGPPSCPPPTDLHDYEIIEQAEPAAKKSVRFIESDDDDLGSSDSDSDDESDSDDGSGDEEAEGGDSQVRVFSSFRCNELP